MDSHLISLVFLLLQFADSVYCQDVNFYHITPSLDIPCPQNPCLTLSQFAASDNQSDTLNISLIFLPGYHSLDTELSLSHVDHFIMTKITQDDETAFVECDGQFGSINISETTFASLRGLHFVGCGDNRVSNVEWFTVEDTIFQGVKDNGTVLRLNEITTASLIRIEFLFNQQPLGSLTGLFNILSSNISIVSSKFMYNVVFDVGVMCVYKSSLHVIRSNFSQNINRGDYGAVVMNTSESSISIDNCAFTNNYASHFSIDGSGVIDINRQVSLNITTSSFINNNASYGGVMYTQSSIKSSFNITNNTFTNNSAWYGGVMYTRSLSESSFNIADNTFTKNSATYCDGGVIYIQYLSASSFNIANNSFTNNSATYDDSGAGVIYIQYLSTSSFSISNNTFFNNSAWYGGIIYTQSSSESTFDIASNAFFNNSAKFGGVMMYIISSSNESSFNITSNTFTNNSAQYGGVIYTHSSSESTFDIASNVFINNSAKFGGVMMYISSSNESSFNITSNTFYNNSAQYGGVIYTHSSSESTFDIASNAFFNNSAKFGGVMMYISSSNESSFNIASNTFTNNSAQYGGVIYTLNSSESTFDIASNAFLNNSAKFGGVMTYLSSSNESSFNIASNIFTNNSAQYGGVIYALNSSESTFDIASNAFLNNSARYGGVMTYLSSSNESSFNIASNIFTNNSAQYGGVIHTQNSSESTFNIASNTFYNNSAQYGGVMICWVTVGGKINIAGGKFISNSASLGGVFWIYQGSFYIQNSSFINNAAKYYGGIMLTFESPMEVDDCKFDHNSGSLYIFNSNLTISGHTNFENCTKLSILDQHIQDRAMDRSRLEGGGITSFQSTVIFNGNISLFNNQAIDGGALLATESTIIMYGDTTISYNNAIDGSGGGISLHQSDLEVKGSCNISSNHAMRGGGIHATSSTVTVYESGNLQFVDNNAVNGSGIYLEVNPRIYILKENPSDEILLEFKGNHADYGGAVYVADDTNSGACSPNIECFIQTLALYLSTFSSKRISVNMAFFGNTASERGSNLFGGLLDRCVQSSFTELYELDEDIRDQYYSGFNYLQNISNIESHSISSLPVRVCFCTSDGQPVCSHPPPLIEVKKGEAFTVSLVAVDQVNNSVEANIISSLSSSHGGFGEGQQIQDVGTNCTSLTYNVFSSHDNETMKLYADGPCGSSIPSIQTLCVIFSDCTCPIGFMPSNISDSKCECICSMELKSYITSCDSTTNSLIKENINSWITYQYGYVTYSNCPFDYCETNVSIDLNLSNGTDAQCNNNRRGVLCGACRKNFSLSLGSSHCLPCQNYWPVVFVAIMLTAIMAGILLVVALLALNMTVAVGLINSFIFYANIVAANSAVFFPSSDPSFPTVFVAWLNLDIGINACFINGLDAYAKTWLQLAFPVYLISLVVLVIIVSEYSPRFAAQIGKRDPIATLATLVLLSYAKLLSVTITALSFATLRYPDGNRTVWLPDGNVFYFQGGHAGLAIMALFIIIVIGVPYTLLLFLWQWLVCIPRGKVFNWTRSTKLDVFVSTYHTPYNTKYRFWPGLLLLVRVVLYITASVTVSANPQASLLTTILLVGGLIFFKAIVGVRVHKNLIVDILETVMLFNLLVLTAFSSYQFKSDPKKQTAVAYISTLITFILLVGAIAYHIFLLIKKKKASKEANEYPLAAIQPVKSEVTRSSLVLPSPPSESGKDDYGDPEEGDTVQEREN